MIDSIRTDAITDLLIDEFPRHKVSSKLIYGKQFYQIKRGRCTIAILCVDIDFFDDLSTADEVRQNVKAGEAIRPLKKEDATINLVLLAKDGVTVNHAVSTKDRQASALLDLLSNWNPIRSLPKFGTQRFPATSRA